MVGAEHARPHARRVSQRQQVPTVTAVPADDARADSRSALAYAEGLRGRLAGWLSVYGRVPLFYYIGHIYVAHAVAIARSGSRNPASCAGSRW